MSRSLAYATVCSGIECMSVAARGLPLRPVFFSEIEPFPCANCERTGIITATQNLKMAKDQKHETDT